MPKVDHNLDVRLSLLLGLHVKTGKSFGLSFVKLNAGLVLIVDFFSRALSEVVGSPLPYEDVLSLRDRMWEVSPTIVRYDTTESTSTDVALAGLKVLAAATAKAKIVGTTFQKPISNFYQTDPISRAWVLTYITFSLYCADTLLGPSRWLNAHGLL
jgi:hypothetical protein